MVLSSVLPVGSITFDEVGAPAHLSGGPSAATNIPVVHTLLAIQLTFDLEPEEHRKRYEKNGRVTVIILVQKLSHMSSKYLSGLYFIENRVIGFQQKR